MRWSRSHWKPLALTAVLLLAAAWYSRPVDVYTLIYGIEPPDSISISLSDLGSSRTDYPLKNLSPEDPEWDAVLESIEALRFRRPPWNFLLQLVPERTTTGRAVHEGDRHVTFLLSKRAVGYIQVQFFIDGWMYHSPYSNRNLTLWVADSRESGEALAEVFQPLLESG